MEREGDTSTSAPEVERRQAPRTAATLEARCRRLGRPSDEAVTTTVDISSGGVRLRAPAQLSVGDVVELEIQAPHGIEVALQGLVVQLTGEGRERHAHVAFDSLSASAADLLTELLEVEAAWSAAEAAAATAVPGDRTPDTASLS